MTYAGISTFSLRLLPQLFFCYRWQEQSPLLTFSLLLGIF